MTTHSQTRRPSSITLVLLVLLSALVAQTQAQAQTTAPRKPARPAKAAPKAPPPPPPLVLEPAGGEQLAAAALTHFGDHACEFNQTLHVGLNAKHDGYVDVRFGKQTFVARPLLSSTGALRLEDVTGRMLLLQIAVKSMLMDVQSGRRVVDECVHEKHLETRRALEAGPPQPGLGIDPARAAASAPASGS